MEKDVIGARGAWLSSEQYSNVRAAVPIACVDVLLSPRGQPGTVGLIRRDDSGVRGWCLVGGRMLRDEPLAAAVERHVTATLGDNVRIDPSTLVLRTVEQYFTQPRPGDLFDPMKHAVSMTHTAVCDGEPRPAGEALEFAWFKIADLGGVEFGCGHGDVIARVLAAGEIPGATRPVTR